MIDLWIDPVIRDGPENMAVDELLWASCSRPLLRTYRWTGSWMSIGYFSKFAVLREQVPSWLGGVVRRPTGGGIVDHLHDWTYSLFLPRGISLAEISASESYRIIHLALSHALHEQGMTTAMCTGTQGVESSLCFRRPVAHDLIDQHGNKIAGAGQRRGRSGLLHQGSLALLPADSFAQNLARSLSTRVECRSPEIDPRCLANLVATKYGNEVWTTRR